MDLQAAVDSIQVNRDFVSAKFTRVQKLAGKNNDPQAVKLLQEVSDAMTDGRFDKANKKINLMLALLSGQ
jgi:hypothetical protein